jgi:hypothetical protein
MWVLVYGANGIVGFDWLWVGLAAVADIFTTQRHHKRKDVPYYTEP